MSNEVPDLFSPDGKATSLRSRLGSIGYVPDSMISELGSGVQWQMAVALGTIAGLGLLFQIGHFAEHAAQFTIWILGDLSNICGRNTPWMSPWATDLVRQIGLALLPAADEPRRMMVSMEVLHLIGNGIFLSGLVCLYYFDRSKWVRWALYIETFHLCEHIMLTTTALFLNKPIGMSTLFGYSNVIGSKEFAVGYRVTWHFAMNLLPMPLAMIGLMKYLSRNRPEQNKPTGLALSQ